MQPHMSLGGLTAVQLIQQAFNPAVCVLVSPDVDLLCSKNRLTFVELLQPFSRLSVEGQVRDMNNVVHQITQFRLSVRDVSWKPAVPALAKRLLSEAVSNYTLNDSKVTISTETKHSVEINPQTPWYDSWRETLWTCLEMTEHDFMRHYLAALLVVSSSRANPLEQLQNLSDQLQQLTASSGVSADGPRWFNTMVLKLYVLVHDACEGDVAKAEETFQSMKNMFGANSCHLLVINSKPKRGSTDPGLPAADPWLRFLSRKTKTDFSTDESESDGSSSLDSGLPDMPVKVDEGGSNLLSSLDAVPVKLPLMDALQDAMQELSLMSTSASTSALSSLSDSTGARNSPVASQRSAVEVRDDPLGGSTADTVASAVPGWRSDGDVTDSGPAFQDTEIHGACLTTDDVDRIQNMINELCLKSLLPHMERQMKLINEAIISRKSTHRSLLSATKRWFGSTRPNNTQAPAAVAVSYHPDSPQLQLRRLGDLAFLLGLYDLAYSSYHSAKKDFEADQAWLHYAGALEMAALSSFLQGSTSGRGGAGFPSHYFDLALTTYLQTCKMSNWATRCAVLACHCLRSTGHYGEAALQLIRLTSEDADLRSAVLLEQAALCFLRSAIRSNGDDSSSAVSSGGGSGKTNVAPLLRKYAFHMILAGHRYGKSGQKKHAPRAYQSALQVYRGHGWSLAEDHIQYTVGRQCLSGHQVEAAAAALACLLKPHSLQSPSQQMAYLNEFIHVHQMMSKHQVDGLPLLPLPFVDGRGIKTLVEAKDPTTGYAAAAGARVTEATHVAFNDEESHHAKWTWLEERIVQATHKPPPVVFRPREVLFTQATTNTAQPLAFCDELIAMEVPLENPLHIPLLMSEIRLLWHFTAADGTVTSWSRSGGAAGAPVVAQIIPRLILKASSSEKVVLYVSASTEGVLLVEGVGFELASSQQSDATAPRVLGRVKFAVQGPRLNNTKAEKEGQVYASDKRLEIQVAAKMPKLQVLFHDLPEFLLNGEIRKVSVQVINQHPSVAMTDVIVACNDPLHVIMDLPRVATRNDESVALYRWDCSSNKQVNMWLRGCESTGLWPLDLIFYYSNPQAKARHRIVRHCSKIFVSSSLSLNTWAQLVPGLVTEGGQHSETLAMQVQIRNLRDADDTSLSGIKIQQVSLLSPKWLLQSRGAFLADEVLHPQEGMLCSAQAIYQKDSGQLSFCESLKNGASIDLRIAPYQQFIKQFQASSCPTTVIICWAAKQASEDGFGTTVIEGQHYFNLNVEEKSRATSIPGGAKVNMPTPLVTYSMSYATRVQHNFVKNRLCIVPVVLHLQNCSEETVDVCYLANTDAGKAAQASQLYMAEAASPLLWIGRVRGSFRLESHGSATVNLVIAVPRAGAYSLARGLQISSTKIASPSAVHEASVEENAAVYSSKLEFTLVVEGRDI